MIDCLDLVAYPSVPAGSGTVRLAWRPEHADSLHDRIHPASGRLLAAVPITVMGGWPDDSPRSRAARDPETARLPRADGDTEVPT